MNDTIFLSSPYGGKVEAQRLAAAITKLLYFVRKEAGKTDHIVVPHLELPWMFDDSIQSERDFSIGICEQMIDAADVVYFYAEFGFSPGMLAELKRTVERKTEFIIYFDSTLIDYCEYVMGNSTYNVKYKELRDAYYQARNEYGKVIGK